MKQKGVPVGPPPRCSAKDTDNEGSPRSIFSTASFEVYVWVLAETPDCLKRHRFVAAIFGGIRIKKQPFRKSHGSVATNHVSIGSNSDVGLGFFHDQEKACCKHRRLLPG